MRRFSRKYYNDGILLPPSIVRGQHSVIFPTEKIQFSYLAADTGIGDMHYIRHTKKFSSREYAYTNHRQMVRPMVCIIGYKIQISHRWIEFRCIKPQPVLFLSEHSKLHEKSQKYHPDELDLLPAQQTTVLFQNASSVFHTPLRLCYPESVKKGESRKRFDSPAYIKPSPRKHHVNFGGVT